MAGACWLSGWLQVPLEAFSERAIEQDTDVFSVHVHTDAEVADAEVPDAEVPNAEVTDAEVTDLHHNA